ncbi:MAG: penicillin-binding protein, partial [Bacteroidota bacterium]
GGEDRATHFANTAYGQGASMALPIWGIYMKKCYADPELNVSKDNFRKPGKISIETNCEEYKKSKTDDGDELTGDEFDF